MNYHRILSRSIATLLALGAPITASAANLIWDANAATLPNPFDGANTWDIVTPRFFNGTTNVVWTNSTSDIAVFGVGQTLFTGIAGAVTLSGAITTGGLDFEPYVGNAAKYNITGGTSLTLGGAATITLNTVYTRPFAAINSVLAGTAGITVNGNGQGILEFGAQTNTFTGGLRLQTGALSIANDVSLGGAGNAITFTGNAALISRATFAVARNITINAGVTGTFDVLNGFTTTYGGTGIAISGAGNLQKDGLGAMTLAGTNTFTGETRVRQGTLTLDFNNTASPASNIINSGSTLRLFGGTLALNGKAATVNAQTFNGLVLDPGASSISSANPGTSLTLNLGAITRNAGATLNLATLPANTTYTTTTGATNGILGGYATVNNADWVAVNAGNLGIFTAYQTGTDATLYTAADNVSLATSPTVPLAGDATINSLKFIGTATVAVPAANTLTLGTGGILVTGGAATISGGTLRGGAGADVVVLQNNTANATTISAIIADNASASGVTKAGAGTLVLSGANTYSGNTFLNGGTLEVGTDANLGGGTTVTARAGTTLRISGGTAFASAKNFQFDFGSNSFGATALAGSANSVGNFNVDVTNTAGATISGAFNVTAGTFVKTGAGTLTLTNSGSNQLGRLNGGQTVAVQNGGIIFNGGAGSEYRVGQGEFTIGDNTPTAATVTLQSGALNVGSFTSIGRGNGTTGLASGLTITGGIFTGGNLYTGFANSVAGYNVNPFIAVSGSGVVNVSDTFRLSESAGSNTTATFSGTSQLLINNNMEIGFGGRAVLRASSGTTTNANQVVLGGAANGIGALFNRGALTVRGGGGVNNFALGNGVGAYGYYLHDTPVNTTVSEAGVGAAGGGSGVLEVRSGTFTTSAWLTINRTNGANATSATLLLSGGNLVPTNIATQFQVNANNNAAALYGTVDVGAGSQILGGNTGNINLNNQGNAGNQGILSVHDGGSVRTTQIFAGQAVGNATVNLNGGTLVAANNGTLLGANLDGVVIYPSGATINTNGFNTTTGVNALLAPTGNGLPATISLATAGAGYLGRPVVRITDSTGTGATAVANFDETTGALTGITVTNPGSGYSAPVITLVGGGFTTAATVGAVTLTPNAMTGGLVKTGNGTLTLGSSSSTYGGPTTISAGTLSVGAIFDGGVSSSLGASSNAASNLVFDGGGLQFTGNFSATDRNFTITAGKTATIDVTLAEGSLQLAGGAAATDGGLTKIGNGTLALNGANLYTGLTSVNGGVLAASGTFGGPFAVNANGRLTPANFSIGTLTVPALTLGTGSAVSFEFGSGNDLIAVTGSNGLILGTTGISLFQEGTTLPFTDNGIYTLFDYTGALNSSLNASFTIANSQVGKVYALTDNTTNTTIDLTIADAISTMWNVDGGGSWAVPANWTAGVPNSIGAIATFGGILTAPSATITVDGPKTVGSIIFDNFNSYNITGGAGETITLNNGFGIPSITLVTGAHSISAPIALAQNTNIIAGFDTSLTLSGNISGNGGLTLTDFGTVTLSGNNTYNGPTTINATTVIMSGANTLAGPIVINAGTLEVNGTASLGGTPSITERNGAVLRTVGATTISQPLVFDLGGGVATGLTGLADGAANFTLEVLDGGATTVSSLFSNATGSFRKRGGGSLTLTNPGANVLAGGVGGLTAAVQNGSLIFDGGAAATYSVLNGELAIGDSTPSQVSVTLASGTLNVATFTSVGRGNGTSGLASSLNITGGTLNTTNLFTGFAGGVGGYNAAPAINVSGSSAVNVTATRIGESFGSNSTLNLSGSTTYTNTAAMQIGFGGTGVATIADSAVVNVAVLAVGAGNNAVGNSGAGVVRQTGGTVQQAGLVAGDWRIGGLAGANDVQAYGSYAISGGSLSVNRNFQIGAFGRGVLDISGTGSVTTSGGFPVVGRFAGGFGLLNISGGSFNQTTPTTFLIVGENGTGVVNVSGTGLLNVPSAPGAAGTGTGTGAIRLGHAVGGSGALNLNGGTVATSGIAKTDATASGAVYLNGGTLRANTSNATFLQGLDRAIVGPGGATLDTAGNNITIAQPLIAPAGSGVSAISLVDGGTGYLGQPIVRITGDGAGATALANVVGGVVTGITITNPGTGYTTAPSVELLGGGGTGAFVDTATLGAAVTTGGLTKTGNGTLTLNGTNTYGGATTVTGGTLVFGVSQTLSALNIGADTTVILAASSPGDLPGSEPLDGSAWSAGEPSGIPVQAVPEPGAITLLATGLLSLLGRRRRTVA